MSPSSYLPISSSPVLAAQSSKYLRVVYESYETMDIRLGISTPVGRPVVLGNSPSSKVGPRILERTIYCLLVRRRKNSKSTTKKSEVLGKYDRSQLLIIGKNSLQEVRILENKINTILSSSDPAS